MDKTAVFDCIGEKIGSFFCDCFDNGTGGFGFQYSTIIGETIDVKMNVIPAIHCKLFYCEINLPV